MLLPTFPIYRPRKRPRPRPRKGSPTPPPPPEALTLTAAAYVGMPPRLTLTFDRAVDIGGFDGSQVTVRVGPLEALYRGGAATPEGAGVVRVALVYVGSSVGAGLRLTATADTGIVAADDGGTWEGVTNLILPFG